MVQTFIHSTEHAHAHHATSYATRRLPKRVAQHNTQWKFALNQGTIATQITRNQRSNYVVETYASVNAVVQAVVSCNRPTGNAYNSTVI